MTLLNYHELTMNEPSNSPAKRQQFLVICSVMVAVLAYTAMTSGILLPIDPQEGVFPGGNFVYKYATRDYAASMGLGRIIRNDFLGKKSPKLSESLPVEDIMYHVYLDNPSHMGGRRQRWMSGVLVGDDELEKVQGLLLAKNEEAPPKRQPTAEDLEDMTAKEVFSMLPYEQADLQAVDALVLQFPFTNGFVSSLMLSYRIIPALRKLAMEKSPVKDGSHHPIVISNCSRKQDMCTHYAPLVQGKDFLLGRPTTEDHNNALGDEHFLDWKGMKQGLRKVFPFFTGYIDKLP